TMNRRPRSTPPGQHRPVLLAEVLQALQPQPGEIGVDCTVGWAGHAVEILHSLEPEGRLLAFDFDPENLVIARRRLEPVGSKFTLHQGNYAGLARVLAEEGVNGVNVVLADLGMSSVQVDDPERGFSYVRDGPLDMRMDRTRGRTAAQALATISEEELREALIQLGDEPEAARIARAIVAARVRRPIVRTVELAQLIQE